MKTFSLSTRIAAFAATLFIACVVVVSTTRGQVAYTFTKIADTDGGFSFFNEFSINAAGTVVFHGVLDNFEQGIFTGNGGPITTIALSTGSPFSTFFGFPAINTDGTVAFFSFLDGGGEGIFRGNGGPITTIAVTSGPTFSSVFLGVIDAAGTVFFAANLDAGGNGIFSGAGGGTTTIYDNTTFFDPSAPSINMAGRLAFYGARTTGGRGIFTGTGGATSTIALETGPPFGSLSAGSFEINPAGTVVFLADLDAGGSGIFTGSGGATTTIALTSGPAFNSFRRPSMNADGQVCFYAVLDAGGAGIFTGPDPVADKIIRTGDPLFGSTVVALHQDNHDLNDSGRAVFRYDLDDGRTGLAVATTALQLTAAVSRKMHSVAGDFDVDLPLSGTSGVECRSTGESHTLVFSFTNNVVSGSASVTSGIGSVAGPPTFSGKTMTVNLAGVANAQTLTVTLSSVTDQFSQVLADTAVSASFLLGDTNANRTVNATDITQTKARIGQTLGATNFRSDVNANGSINATDTTIIKSHLGTAVP